MLDISNSASSSARRIAPGYVEISAQDIHVPGTEVYHVLLVLLNRYIRVYAAMFSKPMVSHIS